MDVAHHTRHHTQHFAGVFHHHHHHVTHSAREGRKEMEMGTVAEMIDALEQPVRIDVSVRVLILRDSPCLLYTSPSPRDS